MWFHKGLCSCFWAWPSLWFSIQVGLPGGPVIHKLLLSLFSAVSTVLEVEMPPRWMPAIGICCGGGALQGGCFLAGVIGVQTLVNLGKNFVNVILPWMSRFSMWFFPQFGCCLWRMAWFHCVQVVWRRNWINWVTQHQAAAIDFWCWIWHNMSSHTVPFAPLQRKSLVK